MSGEMGNYISRQDAMKALHKHFGDLHIEDRKLNFWNPFHVFRVIEEETPSADVRENVHGEWVEYPESLKYEKAYSNDQIVCSECGEVFSVIDNDTERFYFCPNCGADMRKEEE